jgi:hypothetical protein
MQKNKNKKYTVGNSEKSEILKREFPVALTISSKSLTNRTF